jgi:dCMP deaminase
MERPDIHVYMVGLALLASTRATCCRRRVGCVLVDKHNHIMATGYNGVPRGMAHCTDEPCAGATMASGTGLDKCLATHAEQNALLQCRDVEAIAAAYCTTAPCMTCIKLLMNTGCRTIYFLEDYPHAEAKLLWRKADRKMFQITSADQMGLSRLLQDVSMSPALITPKDP